MLILNTLILSRGSGDHAALFEDMHLWQIFGIKSLPFYFENLPITAQNRLYQVSCTFTD